MNPLDPVHQLLDRTASRRRLLSGWSSFWRTAAVAAGAYAFALAAHKVAPVPWAWVAGVGQAALAALPLGFAWGWLRPVTRAQAARFLDARAGLRERLATALEVAGGPAVAGRERWQELVVADAVAAAATVRPAGLLPVTLPRSARWVVLTLAVAAGLGFVPEYRSARHRQADASQAVLKDTGRGLVQFTKRELAARKPVEETTRKAVEEVGQLGERLQSARLSREDALKDLAKATDALRQQSQELARNPAVRQLERAARQSGSSPNQTAEQLKRQAEDLQRQLGKDGREATDAVRELQKDLQKLQEAARGLADKKGAEARSARAELARSLAELSKKAMDQGFPLEALNAASEQLRSANVERFLKDLDLASQDLDKLADLARQLQQAQAQSEKVGKDLAEQLQKGQAQAAQETLQRMMDSLKQPDLRKEQLEGIAKECEGGSQPGSKFGKVGDLLKQAAQKARQGDKSGSKQAMADARKELDALMSQMGDAQQLAAALQSLQKAQACIGNGQAWGQGGQGASRSGTPRGKGRRGFGDWSNDDPWALPEEIAASWDNTGLNRADKEARGQTARDANLPDSLAPTKIQGQFQPGGPMPSITLKGVSIKGSSQVSYTEAVTAAQGDAQAALNQEQVPKAYRNAVRDYFEDLK